MKVLSFSWFLCLLLFSACKSNDKVRIYLVPDGYEGPLIMIEDKLSEDTLLIKGDTTIFDFRRSIILRIKGKFIEGSYSLYHTKYYYIDSLGSRKEVPFALGDLTKMDSSKTYIYLRHTQLRKGSQCDLISTPKHFIRNLYKQQALCDSLFAIHP